MKKLFKIVFVLILFVFIMLAIGLLHYKYVNEQFNNNIPQLHSGIHKVYFINLEHRTDRKEEFLSNFSEKDQSRIIRVNAKYVKENGAIGCLLSHIDTLTKVLQENISDDEIVFIAEDDLHITDMKYLNDMLDLAFNKIQTWDVIMAAHNTYDSSETGVMLPDNKGKIIKIIGSQTASGFIIKKSYAKKMLSIYTRDYNEYTKTKIWADKYCNDQSWKELQKTDQWYAFEPRTAIQRKSYSDIAQGTVEYNV